MLNVHEIVDQGGKAITSPDLFHPGYILKEEIEARGITKKDFAELLNILPTHLSEIFAGKRPIGVKLARRLEIALEISAGFWLRMQSEYDLKLAEKDPDPVLIKIEDILQIQHKTNTSLSKAIIAYEVVSSGEVIVRSLSTQTPVIAKPKRQKIIEKGVIAIGEDKLKSSVRKKGKTIR